MSLPVILVAFGFADGDDQPQVEAAEKQLEIDGILAGGVDANIDLGLRMLLAQVPKPILESLVPLTFLHDGKGWGGALEIGPEERNPMAVAGRVDADTDAVERQVADHD